MLCIQLYVCVCTVCCCSVLSACCVYNCMCVCTVQITLVQYNYKSQMNAILWVCINWNYMQMVDTCYVCMVECVMLYTF